MEFGWLAQPGIASSQGAHRPQAEQSAPPSAGVGAGMAQARTQTPLCRAHRSQVGWPRVSHNGSLPHATCSHPVSAGGGIPALGIRAVHASRCPQTGQDPGGPSVHASPSRGPSQGGGISTGTWPNSCRHRASSSPRVWAYSPQHRTSTAPAGGTWRSQRPINCAMGKRIVRGCAWPPGPLARSSYRKMTCSPSHASSRLLASGPPRR